MKTYRTGFLLALIGNIVLAVVLVGLWLHYRAAKPMTDVGKQDGRFHRAGFDGHVDGHASYVDRIAAGSGANLSATVAEHRGEDRCGRT